MQGTGLTLSAGWYLRSLKETSLWLRNDGVMSLLIYTSSGSVRTYWNTKRCPFAGLDCLLTDAVHRAQGVIIWSRLAKHRSCQ